MTHRAVVRSPVAHALIKKIDLSAAQRYSGVLAVVAAADLLGTVRPAPPNPVEGAEVAAGPPPGLAPRGGRCRGEAGAGGPVPTPPGGPGAAVESRGRVR